MYHIYTLQDTHNRSLLTHTRSLLSVSHLYATGSPWEFLSDLLQADGSKSVTGAGRKGGLGGLGGLQRRSTDTVRRVSSLNILSTGVWGV